MRCGVAPEGGVRAVADAGEPTPHRLNQPTSELDDVGHFDKSSVRTTKAGEVVCTSIPGQADQVDKVK